MTRKIGLLGLGLALALCFAQTAVAEGEMLKYLPGDIIHLVIEAPPDTVQVAAVMPDGQRISLTFNRGARTWDSYWEIPTGFKKGIYSAELEAVDVQGRSFKGKTAPFYIGEPALPVMLKLQGTPEAPAVPPSVEKEAEEVKKEAEAVTAPAPRPKPRVNIVALRMQRMNAARKYLASGEYEKARVQLRALLRIDPNNKEVKAMLDRIDAVIKAKEKSK